MLVSPANDQVAVSLSAIVVVTLLSPLSGTDNTMVKSSGPSTRLSSAASRLNASGAIVVPPVPPVYVSTPVPESNASVPGPEYAVTAS